ncbi:MAG TPA: rhodanese-like domain-containing protein [Smithella sp.]|nr:rhodanese-like domain-containing protein [Smithella sp.]
MKTTLCVSLTLMILTMAGFPSQAHAEDKSKPLIIDSRTANEWNGGHIKGAILIPYDQTEKSIGAVAKDKSQKIYVYCRTGMRAAVAKETLGKLGYKDVVNLGSMEDAARALNLEIVK